MATLADHVYAGIYANSCRFANIERFVDVLGQHLALDEALDGDGAGATLRDLAAKLADAGPAHDDESAQDLLVAADVSFLATTDLGAYGLLAGHETLEERLLASGELVAGRLAALGLEPGASPLRVVDRFPAPFDRFDWSAFSPDREDEERFGIAQGVWFRRDRLRPLYSEALFAHEVVHTLTGRVDPEVYAMGLEEGIAEIVGTCYAGLGVLPADQVRKVMVYGRHGHERSQLWSAYLDHTRQAYLLFAEFGLDGLAELVRQGRAAIQDAEAAVLTGSHRDLDLPRGNHDPATRAVVEVAALGYLPTHVFSPLDCLLARHAVAGCSAAEVCDAAGVDPAVGVEALGRVGSTTGLFVVDGDTVGYSNVGRYLEAERRSDLALIRYLPTST